MEIAGDSVSRQLVGVCAPLNNLFVFSASAGVYLWVRGGHDEIGCVTVISNLAKVRGKQTEQEKQE